jgi:AmmeMemoRadiSam system protein B
LVPGVFYPADPQQLYDTIEKLIDEADVPALPGGVNVCVMPTGSFEVSGSVAAHAVKTLQPGAFDRVIMIAPPTFANFQGCSIPNVHYYRTPLGDVPIDGPAVREITVSTLIQRHSVVYSDRPYTNPQVNRQMLHEREFAIEIPLTFLQVRLGQFEVVPIVVGDIRDKGKSIDGNLKHVLRSIAKIMDDRTLLVVCTDFTRYGAVHDYTPFTRDVLTNISKLDMDAFKRVQARDVSGLRAYVNETGNLKRAAVPLEIGMRLAPSGAQGLMLAYEMSGARQESPDVSVSYASIVFFDPARPPLQLPESKPVEEAPVTEAEPAPPDAP